MHTKKILELARSEHIAFVQMQFMDILGGLKSITLPASQLEKALEEGIAFDGSSILGYATIDESDMRLCADPNTFLILPSLNGEDKTARLLCNIYDHEDKPFSGDPRAILAKHLNVLKKQGWTLNTAPEYEFFYMRQDQEGNPTNIPADNGGYFDLMRDASDKAREETVNYLDALGFEVEASHHEVAPGQHEIDLKYTNALDSADRVAMMKHVTKMIAQKHGLYATFMPKPVFGLSGSGMHTHISIMDQKGKNLFYDKTKPYQLSQMALYFVGGILKYAQEICAILSSSVNSYKRLVPGYEAPVYISWANRNRSAFVRIPAGRESKTRIEIRSPDPTGNPYLQFTVMLAAGLKGIQDKINPKEPMEKDIYHMESKERAKENILSLPDNLGSALDFMAKSTLAREALGAHVFEHFLYIKRKEWGSYIKHVTDWELKHLLPIL